MSFSTRTSDSVGNDYVIQNTKCVHKQVGKTMWRFVIREKLFFSGIIFQLIFPSQNTASAVYRPYNVEQCAYGDDLCIVLVRPPRT